MSELPGYKDEKTNVLLNARCIFPPRPLRKAQALVHFASVFLMNLRDVRIINFQQGFAITVIKMCCGSRIKTFSSLRMNVSFSHNNFAMQNEVVHVCSICIRMHISLEIFLSFGIS